MALGLSAYAQGSSRRINTFVTQRTERRRAPHGGKKVLGELDFLVCRGECTWRLAVKGLSHMLALLAARPGGLNTSAKKEKKKYSWRGKETGSFIRSRHMRRRPRAGGKWTDERASASGCLSLGDARESKLGSRPRTPIEEHGIDETFSVLSGVTCTEPSRTVLPKE
jgi:hypothetical protein